MYAGLCVCTLQKGVCGCAALVLYKSFLLWSEGCSPQLARA
jgi:hypothetical protein